MGTRRLLIVAYHFPPSGASGAFRMLGFARHLPRFGWRVAVVAPPGMPAEPTDPGLLERVPPGTEVRYAPYPAGLLAKPARRFAPKAVWLPRALAACLLALRDGWPDAVLTSGPPHVVHLLGLYLKRIHKIPWIADFRDPWVTSTGSGIEHTRRSRWECWAEGAVMRGADSVVANTPMGRDLLRSAYPAQAVKVEVLTNGYDPDAFPPTAGGPGPSRGAPAEIVHAGILYGGRDPGPLLDAIGDLNRASSRGRSFRVRFLGRSDDPAYDLEAEARGRGLGEAISVAGHVPYDQARAEMAGADILLLLDGPPGRRVGVPAKLYEYIGAGRPILALGERDGDLARVLERSGLPHRIAPPTDRAAIGSALAELADAPAVGEDDGAREGRLVFARERICGQLAEILDGLAARGGGRAPGPEGAALRPGAVEDDR